MGRWEFCGLCVSVCPKKILELSTDSINKKGYSISTITDKDKCIACAICVTICPDVAIIIEKRDNNE